MSLRTLARQNVVKIRADAPVAEASKLMEEKRIGCVVVSNNGHAVGMLTDRDVALRVINKGLDPKKTSVEKVMSPEVITLRHDLGLFEALQTMRDRPMRRFLVEDERGDVQGIFTLDDVLYLIGREMADVASIIEKELPDGEELSPEAHNMALSRRFTEEVWNQGKLELCNELIAPEYRNHDPAAPQLGSGPEGVKQLIASYRKAFPDIRMTIDEVFAHGDKVITRWTCRGTHKGELAGIKPTKKSCTVVGTSITRYRNGKQVEGWHFWDALGLFQQIGAIPKFGG